MFQIRKQLVFLTGGNIFDVLAVYKNTYEGNSKI